MGTMEDHEYLKICASLASCLTVSIASARKKVDLAAAKDGVKDLQARKALALKLLEKAKTINESEAGNTAKAFDQLLIALKHEDNFMVED